MYELLFCHIFGAAIEDEINIANFEFLKIFLPGLWL